MMISFSTLVNKIACEDKYTVLFKHHENYWLKGNKEEKLDWTTIINNTLPQPKSV